MPALGSAMSGRESNAPIVDNWQPGDKTSRGRQVVLVVVLLQVEQEMRPKTRISREDFKCAPLG